MDLKNKKYINRLRERLIKSFREDNRTTTLITTKMIVKFYENNPDVYDYQSYVNDMYNVSCVYLQYSMIDFAARYFNIIKIFCETHLPNFKTLIDIYNNLGVCYSMQNKFALAAEQYEKTLEIQKRLIPDNSSDIANTLCNLGCSAYDLADYDKALKYHLEALSLRKPNDKSLTDNLNFIGYDYEGKNDIVAACDYFTKALDNLEKKSNINPNEYIGNAYYLANVYEKNGNFTSAIYYYEQAIKRIKQAAGETHPFYAQILSKLSSSYLRINNEQKALMLRMKALNIIGETLGENHIYYANSIRGIVNIYLKMKNYEKALKYTLHELDIKSYLIGKNSDDYIKTSLRLCDIYILCNNVDKAETTLKTLAYNNYIDKTNPLYLDIVYALVRLYLANNKNEQLYDLYNDILNDLPYMSFEELLSNAQKAKFQLDNILYNEETNIRIGKSMNINIESGSEIFIEDDECTKEDNNYNSRYLDDVDSVFNAFDSFSIDEDEDDDEYDDKDEEEND